MKKYFKFLLGINIILFFVCFNTTKLKAHTIYDGDVYVESEVAKTNEKIYIDDDLAGYLLSSGINVQTESTTTGKLWWKKTITKKYYEINKNMLKVVKVRTLDYDFDTMLYMVEQIENYAIEYKKQFNKGTSVAALTSGYLRCINPDYCGDKMIYNVHINEFEVFSRSTDVDFIKFINDSEDYKKNSFANYISIRNYFSNCLNKTFYIYNKNGIYEPIDLIHLFCVIDTFDTREGRVDFLGSYRQLTGWLGDLHQSISLLYNYKKVNNPSNFSDLLNYEVIVNDNRFGFDICDLNADLDGLNIAHYYIKKFDKQDHALSKAIGTYYTTLHHSNDKLKYRMFMEYVASMYTNGAAGEFLITSEDKFLSYVYTNCALDYYGRFKGYNSFFPFYYSIMKAYDAPDTYIIENVTRSFCRYILNKASMGIPEGRV